MTKIIPQPIKKEVLEALSFFPQLEDVKITFQIKKNIKKSTMQARPAFGSFFKRRKHRNYLILISEKFKIAETSFSTLHIQSDILVGWIGHELGHILDYEGRNRWNLIKFGINYLFSEVSIVEAERSADTFAVKQGMKDYILKTKNFILDHADISDAYKLRIKKYYLSPEEIMEVVNEHENA
ncbi:hypothetical protein [Changchengzhania lutea]|uniref:hypothetical protein n=1 Tax=Changchengzhania lutea TaxID=2049305 RepID=UPI00115DC847|nr:hypothetical protein [Changchengzhania lutea]